MSKNYYNGPVYSWADALLGAVLGTFAAFLAAGLVILVIDLL